MQKYLKEKKLGSLSDKKQQQVDFQMIQSEVLVPVKLVWEVYSQASANQQCAAKFLCQVNEGAKKDGQTRWVKWGKKKRDLKLLNVQAICHPSSQSRR